MVPAFALLLSASAGIAASIENSIQVEVDAPRPGLTKILLLAGAPSNKVMAHEYFAGCALLHDWLKQQPGVWPILARGWPTDERILKDVKCIVYFGDGGGKQPFGRLERWPTFSRLMQEGVGLVLLHQAMDFPAGPDADKIKSWLGAVYVSDIGCRGHWDMAFKTIPSHEVTRGVKPFEAPADGWLYNLHFAPKGVTPLLVGAVPAKSRTTADAKKHPDRDEVIAWAYQRPAGGRGFGFTGADLHRSWSYASQRTLVLNGILWTAGLPIAANGAQATFESASLQRNLENQRAPVAKKK